MTDRLTDHPVGADHKTHLSILDQVSVAITTVSTVQIAVHKANAQGNLFQPRNNPYQNRFEGNQGNGYNGNNTNRFELRRIPTKINHSQVTPKAQVIFEYTDQNPWDVIHTVRNFINYMKGNPAQRQFFKTNKIVPCRFNTEVNESEIQSSNLEQIQQAVNEDQDLVFDALVAADYVDEINTSNNEGHQSA